MSEALRHAVKAINQDYFRRFPGEACRELADMEDKDVAAQLRALPPSLRVKTWERLPMDVATRVLTHGSDSLIKRLLARADPVRAARVLARLDGERRDAVLSLLDAARARELHGIMQYPDDSAGALMDANFVVLHGWMTAREALLHLRRHRLHSAQQLYFNSDDAPGLRGVSVQALALSDPRTRLDDLATTCRTAVTATADTREVLEQFERSGLADLPVVDVNGELMGVIRHGTLVEAVREDTSADLLTMVGASKEERALSSIAFVVRKRLPWLQINLLTAFLAASVVGLFQGTIAKFTALAVLMPVVAGQSGNTGAQALAVTMRALALREVSVSQWWRLACKEIGAGAINGVAVALTTALGVVVWSGSPGLGLVIATAMVLSMVAAGFAGVIVPIVLSALGQDPAQSSSIILTTITDVTGFFTFLGIATLLSGLL